MAAKSWLGQERSGSSYSVLPRLDSRQLAKVASKLQPLKELTNTLPSNPNQLSETKRRKVAVS